MRTAGTQYGCTDTAPPVQNTPERLSRVLDMLDACRAAGGEPAVRAAFAALPTGTKLEFNYSNWRYTG